MHLLWHQITRFYRMCCHSLMTFLSMLRPSTWEVSFLCSFDNSIPRLPTLHPGLGSRTILAGGLCSSQSICHSQILRFSPYFLQDFDAKLSDFGLARDGPKGDITHVSTRVMGTYGYAAPEYVLTGNEYLARKLWE